MHCNSGSARVSPTGERFPCVRLSPIATPAEPLNVGICAAYLAARLMKNAIVITLRLTRNRNGRRRGGHFSALKAISDCRRHKPVHFNQRSKGFRPLSESQAWPHARSCDAHLSILYLEARWSPEYREVIMPTTIAAPKNRRIPHAEEDFLPLEGTDHIEFYVGNAKQAAHFY